ncbi:MAG TPA: NAD-dependent protein deacetylase [Steroidobacteraceae bacterium]|nr:NAD-dependent protein deacetylase [Steroidobacteraceae bacterium]
MSALREFIDRHPRLAVLTGAGVSTGSGIPDYRDEQGDWKRARPVEFRPFMTDPKVRQRYWARSTVGWPVISGARPNESHRALATLEERGNVQLLITQNVDGLHEAAGSRHVIDLHGRLDVVRCMTNEHAFPRAELQRRLLADNPAWAQIEGRVAPDGDVDLDGRDYSGFVVPDCPRCGGILKPDVVFFGEPVPRERVARAFDGLAQADALLVVGSSLMVYSGYRFAEAAAAAGKPIAAINLGRTRADHLYALKISATCGEVLGDLVQNLTLKPAV